MIKLERSIPLTIQKLQALLRRIPPDHPSRRKIENSLKKHVSGYKGESSIDYYLGFLPEKETAIIHGLRLLDIGKHHFQIDTLILTPTFLLIIEVKNHSGKLQINPMTHQMIQIIDDGIFPYEDPLVQAKRHKYQLESLLLAHKFPPYPIETLVVISHPSSILEFTVSNREYEEKVILTPILLDRFEMLHNKYKRQVLTKNDMNKISSFLLKRHTPLDINILDHFSIKPVEIMNGVHCPICLTLSMVYVNGFWNCGICGLKSQVAYIESLYDRALLLGKEITNSECREFLMTGSPTTTSKRLKKMNLEYTGSYKNRVYSLPYPPNPHPPKK